MSSVEETLFWLQISHVKCWAKGDVSHLARVWSNCLRLVLNDIGGKICLIPFENIAVYWFILKFTGWWIYSSLTMMIFIRWFGFSTKWKKVFFQATWCWNKNKTATFESMNTAATQSSWITVGYLDFLYMRNLAVRTKKFFSFFCIYFLNGWSKSLSACFKRRAIPELKKRQASAGTGCKNWCKLSWLHSPSGVTEMLQ